MIQRKKSEADWAVAILQESQEPMHYQDLIKKIIEKMGKSKNNETITSIYTRLNLDNRLIYQGDGYWYYDSNRILEAR
ncbi:MAG: DNA-directed RNA polymerase subunit delta [Syntrophomonadaceae bacterium]|nr:DNA-directed RNA polymerase subunit delta [Syntrophomonadaceae bacterium]MDD3888608.1 DNA-directed RNA polymerase subunit delta [Syntrophomonadaceae bacterium]MDD4549167.1 DNA-directed RNA polymerase subunit delta [Syntrophomonadaceae bacterium]